MQPMPRRPRPRHKATLLLRQKSYTQKDITSSSESSTSYQQAHSPPPLQLTDSPGKEDETQKRGE